VAAGFVGGVSIDSKPRKALGCNTMVPHFEVAEQRIGKFIISAAKFGVQP
jgi:hypothetical protein